MTFLTRSTIAVLSVVCAFAVQANVAPPAPGQVRAELWSYFENIQQNSPTVLGGLAQSPESMAAIKARIDSMSDTEAAEFQKMLAETPDWKVAPEAFSKAFPPEMLDHIRNVGAAYNRQVPQAEKMRDEVRVLVEVLRLVPDAKLQELGIDRKTIASLEATIEGMEPVQIAMLHRRAREATEWRQQSAAAFETLPAAFRRGAMALTKHGALSEKDIAELYEFRDELVELMVRLEALPEEARGKLKVGNLAQQAKQLQNAPPDVIFMVRHNVPPQMIHQLRNNVALLEKLSRLSDEEKADLEEFRSSLSDAFRSVRSAKVDELLAGLPPEHLFLLEKQMAAFGDWQTAVPAVYETLQSPELAEQIRALEGPAADPVALAELEDFRTQALAFVRAAGATAGADTALAERARVAIEVAPVRQLAVMRMAAQKLPPTATNAARLSIALMNHVNFNCSLSVTAIPEVCFPEVCVDACDIVGEDCEVCTPAGCTPAVVVTANFDLFCNPVESAIHDIGVFGDNLVATMRSGLENALSTVETTINNAIAAVTNTIDTIISAIVDTVNDVWEFVQTLPGKAWDAIKAALDLLLDIEIANGVTLRDLVANGVEHALTSMKNLIGLADGWWNAVASFTLPEIPCPPTGFHTPFGDVGDGAAAQNYARYRLVIDGIIGMIPDTETSLAIKIPAQVLYMAYDFLGLCLEQAAADADSNELTARHNLVLTNFSNMQLYVAGQVVGLTSTYDSQITTISNLLGVQSNNIQASTRNHSSVIQGVVNTESNEMNTLIDTEGQSIKDLIQTSSDQVQSDLDEFQKLNLKLTIERVLQAGANNEVALFQLRPPNGHLDLVREVVREAIDALSAAGEGIGQARRIYDDAVALMNQGKDKNAFREFARAYQQATK